MAPGNHLKELKAAELLSPSFQRVTLHFGVPSLGVSQSSGFLFARAAAGELMSLIFNLVFFSSYRNTACSFRIFIEHRKI